VMRAFGASAGALFLAIGRPDLRTKVQLGQLALLAGAIYPLYQRYGVLGVAWAVSLYQLLSLYAAVLCFRLCSVPLSRLLLPAAQIATATLLGALAGWLAARGLARWPLAALLAAGAAATAVMLGVVIALDRRGGGYRLELEQAWKALRRRRGTQLDSRAHDGA